MSRYHTIYNPYVFANYGQPQRRREYVSPVVFQTGAPMLHSELDQDYSSLAPGVGLIGNYERVGVGSGDGLEGLGAIPDVTLPRDTVVRASGVPHNISSQNASSAASLVKRRLENKGWYYVNKVGWVAGGKIDIQLRLRDPRHVRDVLENVRNAGKGVEGSKRAYFEVPKIEWSYPKGYAPPADEATEDLFSEMPTEASDGGEPFWAKRVAGLPVWAIGLGSVALVGTVVVVALKKKGGRAA